MSELEELKVALTLHSNSLSPKMLKEMANDDKANRYSQLVGKAISAVFSLNQNHWGAAQELIREQEFKDCLIEIDVTTLRPDQMKLMRKFLQEEGKLTKTDLKDANPAAKILLQWLKTLNGLYIIHHELGVDSPLKASPKKVIH